jgi:hypothetical protein
MSSVGNYVILYRPTKQDIAVAQVVHSARDIVALFRERGGESPLP